jgi:hypothetical protein
VAEFEELSINVKVDDKQAAENHRQLKDALRGLGDVQHIERFQRLAREFKLTDVQIKQLAETINKPTEQLANIARLFSRGGAAFLAVEAAMVIHRAFTGVSMQIVDISNAARLIAMHPRQLEEDVRALERLGIERQRAISMFVTFGQKRDEFLRDHSEFKKSLEEMFNPEFGHVLHEHFRQLAEAPDQTAMENLVLKMGEQIEKFEIEQGKGSLEQRRLRGTQNRQKYLERWFGTPDIIFMTKQFVAVSEEAKQAWDKNETVAREYIAVTASIKNNINDIIASTMSNAFEALHITPALRALDALLKLTADQAAGVGTPKTQQELRERLNRQLRERKQDPRLWLGNPLAKLLESLGLIRLPPAPATPPVPQSGGAQPLLETYTDNQSDLLIEEKRLVENIAFLNALLSGESSAAARNLGPGFHNAPQGGATGESNPMRLPDGEPQPGGGGAAESRPPPGTSNALQYAQSQLGLHEIRDQQKLWDFFKAHGYSQINPKSVAWCAAWANSVLESTGYPTSSSPKELGAAAGSFTKYGTEATREQVESGQGTYIGVIKGKTSRTPLEGKHIAFLTGKTRVDPDTGELQYEMLGGNQPDPAEPGKKGPYTGEGRIVSKMWRNAKDLYLRRAPEKGAPSVDEAGFANVADYLKDPEKKPEEVADVAKGQEKPEQTAQRAAQPFSTQELVEISRAFGAREQPSTAFSRWASEPGGESQNIKDVRQYPYGSVYNPRLKMRAPTFGQEGAVERRLANMTDEDFEEMHQRRMERGRSTSFGVDWAKDITESERRTGERFRERERLDAADQLIAGRPRDQLERDAANPNKIDLPPIDPDERPEPSGLAAGRKRLDRDMGNELDVSGKLNVKVDAPAGTEVKATGDGMFKNGVSLDRSLPAVM